MLALGLSTFAAVGLVLPMSADLAVSPGAIGLVITAFSVTYAIMAPVLQMLLGGMDRRVLVMIGLGSLAIGSLLSALATDYGVLLAARLAMGMGAALTGPMALTAGAALVPPERAARALGVVMSGMTLAAVLGLPVATWLGARFGWRVVFGGVGLLALLDIALVARFVPSGSRGQRATPAVLLSLLADRVFLPAVAVTFFELCGHYTTYALVSLFLASAHGLPMAMVPMALFACGLGGLSGNLIASRLAMRVGITKMMAIALAAKVISFLCLIVLPLPGPTLYGVLFLWSAAGLSLMAPQQTRLLGLSRGNGNMAMALNSSAIYAGIACGSALSGAVFTLAGPERLPHMSLVLIACGIFSFRLSRRREAEGR